MLRAGGGSAGPQRYRMTVAYDGSAYAGWQIQPAHPSVQERLEAALEQLSGHRPRVHSSGRTDTGVHARGQVAHFDLPASFDPQRLRRGLNAVLPTDIRVLDLAATEQGFHARFGAEGKEYRYFIWNDDVMPPFLARYRTLERKPLDIETMRRAAEALVGRHDFAAFSANPNREIDGTVRHLQSLRVSRRGREVVIAARGDGFLYRMVRSLAGFLIRVGRGELSPDSAAAILDSRLRTARVPTAPPQGLFLWQVTYGRRKPVHRGDTE